MKSTSIKTKMVLVVTLCLLVGAVVLISLIDRSYNQNVALISHQALSSAQKGFHSLIENDTKALSATLMTTLQNEEIRRLYQAGERDKLAAFINPLYENLKSKFGMTHWLFIEPESTRKVFLRMQKTDQFGDARKLATYEKSIASKDFSSGLDLGKNGFALRVVHPYYDAQNKLIGYMEMGEKIDKFLATMKKQTGDDYGLLVKKESLDKENYILGLKTVGQRNNWDDQPEMVVLDKTTPDETITRFDGDISRIPYEGEIIDQIKKNDRIFIRGIFPLSDASQKVVGAVFVLRDITPVYAGMQQVKTYSIISIAVLLVAMSLIIIFALKRLIFARLAKTMEVATRVVGGEFETKIVPESNDEVGQLEQLLEQFRTVFVNTVNEHKEQTRERVPVR